MKDIIKVVDSINGENYEKISKDDLLIVMLKAKAIVSWNIDNKNMWKEIENTISRFTITAKVGNQNEDSYLYALGTLYPIIRLVENYYNTNAVLFVADETEEQIRTRLMKGYLMDIICKIQTMNQNGWSYQGNQKKTFMFHCFEMVSENLLKFLEDDNYILPEDICKNIEDMNNLVNKEFTFFWNTAKK